MHLMDLLRRMGAEGRTVLFTSHILEEVEQLARHIEVVVAGRHAASRRLPQDPPADDRPAAPVPGALQRRPRARRRADRRPVDRRHRGRPATEGALRIQAVDFGRFTALLPRVAREHGIRLLTVSPSDESLESVFSYLVAA